MGHEPDRTRTRQACRATALFVLLAGLAIGLEAYFVSPTPSLLFQSHLPDRLTSVPVSWIWAAAGGIRQFGSITVEFPPGFTDQGGANVFGDILINPLFVKNLNLVAGTEIALGIWPPNDQVLFQLPIVVRITVDASKIDLFSEHSPTIVMYNPETGAWDPLPSEFDEGTSQISTAIQLFRPVSKDFENWGGRTFIGLALERSPTSEEGLLGGDGETPAPRPTYTSYPTYTPYPTHTPPQGSSF